MPEQTPIRSWLRRLLSPAEQAAAEARQRAAAPTPVRSSQPSPLGREIALQVRDLLASSAVLRPGQINVIDIGSLRNRLGSRWPALEERVHAAADTILRQSLSENDVVSRCGRTEYLVISASLPPEAAQLRCVKIAEALYRHFLGEGHAGPISIQTAVGHNADGPIFERSTSEEIVARHRARATTAQPPMAAESRPTETGPIVTPSDAPDPRPPAAADLATRSDALSPGAPAQDVSDDGLGPPAAHAAEEDDDAFSNRDLPLPRFVEDERPADPCAAFLYTPFWDLQQQTLASYFCSAAPIEELMGRGGDFAPAEEALALARRDLATLKHALFYLSDMIRVDSHCVLALPVQFETLANPRWRRVYVSFALSSPRRLRQHLTMELCGLPEGVTQGRVLDMVNMLKPFCRAVLVRFPLSVKSFGMYSGMGIHAVGADLAGCFLSEEDTIIAISRFVAEANKVRLASYLHNVNGPNLAMAAFAAGTRYIDNDAISHTAATPQQLQRYSWSDFIARTKLSA